MLDCSTHTFIGNSCDFQPIGKSTPSGLAENYIEALAVGPLSLYFLYATWSEVRRKKRGISIRDGFVGEVHIGGRGGVFSMH
jgi:hypothetical protein